MASSLLNTEKLYRYMNLASFIVWVLTHGHVMASLIPGNAWIVTDLLYDCER